jgi:hypothetical protein
MTNVRDLKKKGSDIRSLHGDYKGTQTAWRLRKPIGFCFFQNDKSRLKMTHFQRSWLRHYARSWKVGGSSHDEVDFFNLPNPSSRTMALGST